MRTVGPFLFRPGFLAREYVDGRRARYSSPFRIYLFCSFAFFFLSQFDPQLKSGRRLEFHADVPGAREAIANSPGRVSAVEAHFLDQIDALNKLDPQAARQRFSEALLSATPKIVFALLPLFALLLKLLYRKSDAFYVDHLILTLHLHAFAFLIATPFNFMSGKLLLIVPFVLTAHTVTALKRFYRQSWLRTLGKLTLLGVLYLIPLLIALCVAVVLAIYNA